MAPSNKPLFLGLGIVAIVVVMILTRASKTPQTTTASVEKRATTHAVSLADTTIPEDPLARVFYLLDISGSAHGTAKHDPLREAAKLIKPAVTALSGLDEILPQEHVVGTIGSAGLRQEPLCRIPIRGQHLFSSTDTSWYKGVVDECVRRLTALPAEPYTDIRGALDFAAQTIGGSRPAMRAILLFSDLLEDLPPGQVAATPALKGICVAVFAVITDSLARRPDLLRHRQLQWERDIRKWGAREIRVWTTNQFNPAELRTFIRSCERR